MGRENIRKALRLAFCADSASTENVVMSGRVSKDPVSPVLWLHGGSEQASPQFPSSPWLNPTVAAVSHSW